MKKLFGVFLLLILVGLAGALTKDNSSTMASLKKLFHTPSVSIKGQTFSVTVVSSVADREKGLSGRDSLPQNEGMLFLFDKPDYYAFWMKNMKFPLDIIFIHNNQVVTVYNNLQAPPANATTWQIVKPSEPSDRVLEINAGIAAKYHMQTGDTVIFSL